MFAEHGAPADVVKLVDGPSIDPSVPLEDDVSTDLLLCVSEVLAWNDWIVCCFVGWWAPGRRCAVSYDCLCVHAASLRDSWRRAQFETI